MKDTCTGCKRPIHPNDQCDRDHCYHRKCSLEKGLNGCWECDSFPCEHGRFTDENRGQSVGLCQYIRDHSKEALVQRVVDNEAEGIHYPVDGAYRHRQLDEVRRLLKV